jgi:eukaryotic-like serine/threonine-protein kinase
MAPEQAAADPAVDYRADIYALGVLGYEMLSGEPPFAGISPQETLAAQITREPEPVIRRRPDAPAAFADLVTRCLAKRPADRPQAALELLPVLDAAGTPTGGTPPFPAPRPFSMVRLVFAVSLVAIAGIVALVSRARDAPLILGTESRITDQPGLETDPVISPDGRFIAYAAGPYFTSQIYVRQLGAGPALDVTASLPGRHIRPRWKPGGGELLFVTTDGRTHRISVVSELGGSPRVLVEVTGDAPIVSADWSPDGRRIAYDLGRDVLLRAVADTTTTRVYHGTDPHSLSWSPDGRRLALVEGGNRFVHGLSGLANTSPSTILVLPVGGGKVDTVSPAARVNLSPAWTRDSRSLLFISNRDGAEDIYQVPLEGGRERSAAVRLTTGLNAHTVTFSHDGRHLAYSTLLREANVWVLPLRPGHTVTDDSAVQVTSGNQVVEQFSVSHDGRWLAYDSDRRGSPDIYRLRLDQPGAVPEQLTSDSAEDFAPAWSPNDREILYHRLGAGHRNLWLMGSDGSNPHQITFSDRDLSAGTWAPSGQAVSLSADSAGVTWLGIVTRDTAGVWGTPRLLLPGVEGKGSWSPDGGALAAVRDGALVIITVATGESRTLLPATGVSLPGRNPIWSADGRSVLYRRREPDGRLTLISVPVEGGPPTVLVQQRDGHRTGPRTDWTTDGRRLFFTISRYEGDISVVNVK